MYTLMAKTEEVTQAMKVVQANASRMYPFDLFNKYCKIWPKYVIP